MSYLFNGCSSLEILPDISKWNTKKVNNIEGIFKYCSKLLKFPDISKWNINNIKETKFNDCFSSITSFSISEMKNKDKLSNYSTQFSHDKNDIPQIGFTYEYLNKDYNFTEDNSNLNEFYDHFFE